MKTLASFFIADEDELEITDIKLNNNSIGLYKDVSYQISGGTNTVRVFEDLSTRKKIVLLFLSTLLSFSLVLAPVTSAESATPAEQTQVVYQITEQELTQLETNLVQLKSINTKLQRDLIMQSQEATLLRKQLEELKKELEQLRSLSQTQESSLSNANRLLEQYAIDAKRERLRIKAQRNAWEVVAAWLVVGPIVK